MYIVILNSKQKSLEVQYIKEIIHNRLSDGSGYFGVDVDMHFQQRLQERYANKTIGWGIAIFQQIILYIKNINA